jgi:hypothetical protein
MEHTMDTNKENNLSLKFYHQDGLLDIFIGISITIFGISMVLDQFYLAGIVPAVFAPLWPSVRQAITYPRIGERYPSPMQKTKMRSTLTRLMGLGALGLLLGVVFAMLFIYLPPGSFDWLREYFMLILGCMGTALFFVLGFTLGVKRLYIYGVLTLIIFTTSHILNIAPWIYMTALGCVVLLSGMVLLIRFLNEHPKHR